MKTLVVAAYVTAVTMVFVAVTACAKQSQGPADDLKDYVVITQPEAIRQLRMLGSQAACMVHVDPEDGDVISVTCEPVGLKGI